MKLIKFLVLFCFVSTSIPFHVVAVDYEKECEGLGFNKNTKPYLNCMKNLKQINKDLIIKKRQGYLNHKQQIHNEEKRLENKKIRIANEKLPDDIKYKEYLDNKELLKGLMALGAAGGLIAGGALAGGAAGATSSGASTGLNAGTMSVLGIVPKGAGGPVNLGY